MVTLLVAVSPTCHTSTIASAHGHAMGMEYDTYYRNVDMMHMKLTNFMYPQYTETYNAVTLFWQLARLWATAVYLFFGYSIFFPPIEKKITRKISCTLSCLSIDFTVLLKGLQRGTDVM